MRVFTCASATVLTLTSTTIAHDDTYRVAPGASLELGPRTEVPSRLPDGGDFVDVTNGPLADAGVGEGVAWGDYDGDGDQDMYLGEKTGPNHLLRNDGGDTFVDVTAPPLDDPSDGEGISWADYDDDGDLDLYLVNTFSAANKLFRNDGTDFADVTTGPLGDTKNGEGCAWIDYDNDGDLDIYVTNVGQNRLFKNLGGGTFVSRAGPLGIADGGMGRSATWGDVDRDGDLDLYVSNELVENKLFRNDPDGFADVTNGLPLGDTGSSQGAAFADYDNDGDLDLYVANRNAVPNKLLRNDGGTAFADATTGALGDTGVGFGVAWADYDNDGDLDLYLANVGPNVLFRNDGGMLVDATVGPLDLPGNSRGAAWCDYDRDGDLDLYVVQMEEANRLFRNDMSTGNHWFHLDLVGTVSNRSAIGARVRLVAGGSSQIREISSADGYHSQSSLTAEFGLGAATVVDTVEVSWPSGIVTTVGPLVADQFALLVEPAPTHADLAPPVVRATIDLHPNDPNPFRTATTIRFDLPEATRVHLFVHDVAGRRVRTLVAGDREPGHHAVDWDGRDQLDRAVGSGVYFVRMEAGSERRSRRLVRLN